MKASTFVPSITDIPLSIDKFNDNELLERVANNLVESILADALLLKNFDDADTDDDDDYADGDDDDDDDKNSGVRELSEDENGLRELDENDMSDTDEFIVFATKAEFSDDDQNSSSQRSTLNKLYTFSRINHHTDDDLKQINLDQVCSVQFRNFFQIIEV